MSNYPATIRWQRNEADFFANNTSRAHNWEFDSGLRPALELDQV